MATHHFYIPRRKYPELDDLCNKLKDSGQLSQVVVQALLRSLPGMAKHAASAAVMESEYWRQIGVEAKLAVNLSESTVSPKTEIFKALQSREATWDANNGEPFTPQYFSALTGWKHLFGTSERLLSEYEDWKGEGQKEHEEVTA